MHQITVGDDTATIGTEVLLRLRDGLDPRVWGTGWRIGTITAMGVDLLLGEPVIELDDGGPRIYAHHIDFMTILPSGPQS